MNMCVRVIIVVPGSLGNLGGEFISAPGNNYRDHTWSKAVGIWKINGGRENKLRRMFVPSVYIRCRWRAEALDGKSCPRSERFLKIQRKCGSSVLSADC